MSRLKNDALFKLIKSLSKSEKRQLKITYNSDSNKEFPLFIQVFDTLEQMEEYDEDKLLKELPAIKKRQLSNLKSHLFYHILENLRWLSRKKDVRINIRQLIDYGQVLYNKGLYKQSLNLLDKAKRLAIDQEEIVLKMEILEFEKLIEGRHITRSIETRAQELNAESADCIHQLNNYSHFGNLALALYGKYLEMGHVRNEQEAQEVQDFFENQLPHDYQLTQNGSSPYSILKEEMSFYERINLYQAFSWYAYILQDFLMYYRYTQKWVDLFDRYPNRREVDPSLYLKSMHNLMTAHFFNRNQKKFNKGLKTLEEFWEDHRKEFNENTKTTAFVYLYTARINKHFLEGTFSEGLRLVPALNRELRLHRRQIDQHRVLLFYYKIACLYFGSGDSNMTVSYLNRIINLKIGNLRSDIQCFARILHLIAHFELKNYDLTEYLLPSVSHFLEKNKEMSAVLNEILKFLKYFNKVGIRGLRSGLVDLKDRLEEVAKDPYERRFFLYLDVISWLESKINKTPVQGIIQEKFRKKVPRI